MSQPEHLAAGTLLDGKWRLGPLLGEGGMGAVYEAHHERNNLAVAVKVLHAEHTRDANVRARFMAEGYLANKVGHPGTVRVLDDGTTPEGLSYLVMERLHGETLDALAERSGGRMPVVDVVRAMEAWLEVIAVAHEKGIVHRDLKPENVFVLGDGTIKVLDFGVAHLKELANAAKITMTGVPMGTPAFMPPEQALARWDQVSARSDVYALAASMWTLLTGQLVHPAKTLPEMLVMVSTMQARPLADIVPTVPPGIARVVDRGLRFEPDARWADARAMLEALRAATREDVIGASALDVRQTLPAALPGAPSAARTHAADASDDRALPTRTPRETTAPVSSSSPARAKTSSRRAAFVGAAAGLAVVFGVGLGAFLARDRLFPAAPPSTPTRAAGAVTPPAPTSAAPTITPVDPPASSAPPASASASAAPSSPGGTVTGRTPTPKPKPTGTPTAAPAVKPPPGGGDLMGFN